MQELVFMVDGELRTSSKIIAEGTLNNHASIKQLINKYLEFFNEFGLVLEPILKIPTKGGVQSSPTFLLNEKQTAFLLTLMRNNEIVINFKMNLIKAFYRLEIENKHLQSHIEHYSNTFSLNPKIPETLPIGFGIVYAIEYGNKIKIGHSINPKRRLQNLKHQAEKYSGVKSNNYALSCVMTNYTDVECYLHRYFSDVRVRGTELFNISLEKFLNTLPEIKVETNNNNIVENLDMVSNTIHNFILQDRS